MKTSLPRIVRLNLSLNSVLQKRKTLKTQIKIKKLRGENKGENIILEKRKFRKLLSSFYTKTTSSSIVKPRGVFTKS